MNNCRHRNHNSVTSMQPIVYCEEAKSLFKNDSIPLFDSKANVKSPWQEGPLVRS